MDKKQTQYQKFENETAQAHKSYDSAVDKKSKYDITNIKNSPSMITPVVTGHQTRNEL